MRGPKAAGVTATLLAGCSVFFSSGRLALGEQAAEACPVPKVIAPRPARAENWPAWVTARVQELQPTTQERKIDQIGWARTIVAAKALAREHDRPVFLFTHDGRINTGRC